MWWSLQRCLTGDYQLPVTCNGYRVLSPYSRALAGHPAEQKKLHFFNYSPPSPPSLNTPEHGFQDTFSPSSIETTVTGHSKEQNGPVPTLYSPPGILPRNICWKDQIPKSLIFPYFHGCQSSGSHFKFAKVSQEHFGDVWQCMKLPINSIPYNTSSLWLNSWGTSAHTLLPLLHIRNRSS